MKTGFVGKEVLTFTELGSTNDYCKELLSRQRVTEGTVVNAKWQSSGRGLGNNSWESDPGSNLTFSIILYPHFLEASAQFYISMVTSLGITDFLEDITGNISIKWPNDIYAGEKKIAGILIENSVTENSIVDSIVGIGININQTQFRGSVPNPVSLAQLVPEPPSLKKSLQRICERIEHLYTVLKRGDKEELKARYTKKLFRLNETHMFMEGSRLFNGVIRGVDDFGRLVLETGPGQLNNYGFKEIEFN